MKKHLTILLCGFALLSGLSAMGSNTCEDFKKDAGHEIIIVDDNSLNFDLSTYKLFKNDLVAPEVYFLPEEAPCYQAMEIPKTVNQYDLVTNPIHAKHLVDYRIRC